MHDKIDYLAFARSAPDAGPVADYLTDLSAESECERKRRAAGGARGPSGYRRPPARPLAPRALGGDAARLPCRRRGLPSVRRQAAARGHARRPASLRRRARLHPGPRVAGAPPRRRQVAVRLRPSCRLSALRRGAPAAPATAESDARRAHPTRERRTALARPRDAAP